jgi:hypothetical protein
MSGSGRKIYQSFGWKNILPDWLSLSADLVKIAWRKTMVAVSSYTYTLYKRVGILHLKDVKIQMI